MKRSSNRLLPRRIGWTLALAMTVWGLLFADVSKPLIEVTAEVDRSVITIGDRIVYSLTITRHKDLKIEQPGPAANLGMFEIKDYNIHDPIEENGVITERYDYTISVFDTGKFVIPPFPVAFFASDTSRDYQIIQSEPIEITVESLLKAEDTDIRDIKPPLSIPFNYVRIALIGGAVLLLLAAIVFGVYYYRKRKKGEPLFKKEIIRPAHEIAVEQLEALLAKSYPEEGRFKDLFTELSDILRHYLENRFFITAMEETTTEVLESIQEVELPDDAYEKLKEVLDLSDLVKFAKYQPTPTETERAVELTREFINLTRLEFKAIETVKEIEEEALSPDGEMDEKGEGGAGSS